MAAVLAGITQHGVLAWDVGKAPEIGDIRELGAAGGDPLVATCPGDKAFTLGDGTHRRFQQDQAGDAAIQPMRQNFSDAPSIRAARPGQGTGGEPARVKPGEARPGALVLFRMAPRAIAKHVGILTAPDRFIHAYERLGVVEEVLTPAWARKIAFAFLFPKD